MATKIRLKLLADLKSNLQEIPISGESFWRVWSLASFFQKHDFVLVNQICHFTDLNRYSTAQKIRVMLLTDFKKDLWETPINGESFWRDSSFAWSCKKNDFVFVEQIWHCKTWTNTPWPRRFDLGFWQSWKQLYRKLQYREKAFEEFQGLFFAFSER